MIFSKIMMYFNRNFNVCFLNKHTIKGEIGVDMLGKLPYSWVVNMNLNIFSILTVGASTTVNKR